MNFISTAELLRNTADIYKRNFLKFFLIGFITLLPLNTVKLFIPQNINPFVYLIVGIALTLLVMLGQLTLYFAVSSEGGFLIGSAFARATKKFHSYFWISLLVGLLTFLGFIFLIIPGIILSILFSLSVSVLVWENLKGARALIQSRNYIRGFAMQVFGKYFAISLIAWVFLFIVTTITKGFSSNIKIIISTLVYALVMPFATIYTTEIYKHLKLQKGILVPNDTKKKRLFLVLTAIFALLLAAALFVLFVYLFSDKVQ